MRRKFIRDAGRSLPLLVVAVALFVGLSLGGAAAVCRYRINCGVLHGHERTDAELLAELQQANAGSPKSVLPRGYREQIVASGFTLPTDFAFLPGGDVLVSEKGGLVYDVTPPRPAHRVVLDLRRRIDTFDYRGIVTVAVSPTFARDRRFYVLYVPKPLVAGKPPQPTVARLSSFELPAAGGPAVHEHVLIGSVTTRSCTALPATADCLPSDLDHDGGQIAFDKHGSLFVATGDGGGYDERVEPSALAAQNVDSLAGKILHIKPSGAGLAQNPYWNGNPGANRSKVWAVGLRNPFRLTLDPATGTPVVGDVGAHAYEEIDAAPRGANLGWPCFEAQNRTQVYGHTPLCTSLYRHPPASLRRPLVAVPHPVGNSIVGGTFAPASFSPPFRGAYLFGDWVRGWIHAVRLSPDDGTTLGATRVFATKAPGPVAIHAHGGDVYYVALNSGDLRRIEPVG